MECSYTKHWDNPMVKKRSHVFYQKAGICFSGGGPLQPPELLNLAPVVLHLLGWH